MGRAFAAVLVTAALVVAGTASARMTAVPRITFVTPAVSPGGTLTIRATAPMGDRCFPLVRPAQFGKQFDLAAKKLTTGRATWTYRLAPSALTGTWRVFLNCTRGTSALRSFRVGSPPVAPAQIVVVKSGFSTEVFGSETFLRCGVRLQNTSMSDARDVAVTVTFVDTQGRSLTSDEVDLAAIPAGQTFYASCLTISNVTLSVASVQVAVKIGKNVADKAGLPVVSGLQLTPDGFGTQTLNGSITNPYSQAMPQDAMIYTVYFDASGNIVGGDSEQAGAAIQPGATVGFSFPFIAENVASAQVSVDPCGLAATLSGCALP